uniref:Uncharacterized protein n=1 Tax=Oryza glumipatula TaxID=40148 RepID=A0A0D9YPB5_9ORYZ
MGMEAFDTAATSPSSTNKQIMLDAAAPVDSLALRLGRPALFPSSVPRSSWCRNSVQRLLSIDAESDRLP